MRVDFGRGVPWVILAVVYGTASLLPFRVFFPRFSTHLIGDHGDALLQHLHCAWQWLALAEGRFSELLELPTMHPYSSGLAFGEPLVGIALPFAPVYAVTGSSPAAFNTAIIASFFLLGLAVFLWVRDLFAAPAAGLFAAVLVLFNPWRLFYLTAANLLTIHYLVFGLFLLGRWLRRPRLLTLLGAALLFHVQLITAAQGAIAGIYLACIWLAVVWLRSGLRLSRQRILHGVVAGGLFVVLGLPWLAFFQEALDATSGLLRTTGMRLYSAAWTRRFAAGDPFAAMLRGLGAFGPLGIFAALGIPAVTFAARRRLLPPGTAVDLLGLGCGVVVLLVFARGPYIGSGTDPTALSGYFAARALPFLDAFRAPIRLAALTPVYLALLAGSAFATLQHLCRRAVAGRWMAVWWFVPLLFAGLWPELDPGMASPIAARPGDRLLATRLAALPPDSVLLSLPMALNFQRGAAVDERVLIHRHAQIGGFASIVPEVFRRAERQLGQWPRGGLDIAHALGTTHVVVPDGWVHRHASEIEGRGYEVVASVAGRTILSLPTMESSEPTFRLRTPSLAAVDRWLTLSLHQTPPSFHPRGHQDLTATWRTPEASTRVRALAFFPGVVGPRDPILIHVPTPEASGRYRLNAAFPGFPIEATVDVRHHPTTFDTPIRHASITLAAGYQVPDALRAGAAFRVDVDLAAVAGPILLAVSRHGLPHRRGETEMVYQFRPRGRSPFSSRLLQRTTLSGDLAPGDRIQQTWYPVTPAEPGTYDLFVRLRAHEVATIPMPWIRLLSDLQVVAE
jgi:hypothetical protein